MIREEAKHKLDFMKKAYQKLIDEKVDNGRFVGKDVIGTWKAGTTLDEAYKSMIEALDMAIKALEQEPCDAISRQAVIDGISKYFHDEYYQRTSIQDCRDCLIEDVITKLPPVTPQPKTGQCKECKYFNYGIVEICKKWGGKY